MSKALTLSLVIPAYNEERHIEACLKAVAEQTEMPDEVIVVDNNSTDKTAEMARQFQFVRVMHEPKQGVTFARSRGFDAAIGDIIGRIDADSIIPQNWVAHIKKFYADERHATTAWTSGCHYYNVRAPRLYGWAHGLLIFGLNRLLLGYDIVWGTNMALPRHMWQAVRESTCQRADIHEDLDLSIHLHEYGFRTYHAARPKVGAKLRRIRSERHLLWSNLQWWPRTLRLHHVHGWVICWLVGTGMVYIASPLPVLLERTAHVLGRQALPE